MRAVVTLCLASAIGFATLWLLNVRGIRQEAERIIDAGHALGRLHPARPTCAVDKECSCDVPSGAEFTECRVIEGNRALAIASNDACFVQWFAVEHTWSVVPNPKYFGRYWVSRQPREIAPGWSLLAVAPCVD